MAVDIVINETIDLVDITVNPNIIEVNVTRTSGGGGSQTLAQTLDLGNSTGGENILINNADAIELENSSKLSQGIVDAGTGGNKGIALTCAVGFEWKFEAGEAYLTETTSEYIRLKQYARSLPSVNDDISKGFVNGSFWYLDSGIAYICTDSTNGAAVWEIYHNFIPTLQQVVNEGGQLTDLGIAFDSVVNPNLTAGINIDGLAFIDNDGIDEETTVYASNGIQRNLNANGTLLNFETPTNSDNVVLVPNGSGTLAFTSDIPAAGVPYTGATADVNLGEFGLLTGNIEFDNTPTNIPTGAGSMVWNDTDGTVDLKLKGGNVTLQVGQENVLRVVNKTATNINLLEANYQAVRVTGAQGQRLKVDLAQATTDALSAETIGLVTETINNNQEGFITTSGLIRNVNTTGSLQSETWADGDILYLSPTVAGRVTKVKPTAPNHLVIIGYVVSAHATQGSIFVKVDNGYELNELHNVNITSETNNQLLAYTSATDIWENKNLIDILEDFNKTKGIYFFEEFMGSQGGGVTTSFGGLTTTATGAGASCITTATITNRTNQQGVARSQTGTTNAGNAGFIYGSNFVRGLGTVSIESYANVETLSTVTERFFTFFGHIGVVNYQNPANGIFFTYDEGGVVAFGAGNAPSPNWKCVAINSLTRTFFTSSVAVVAGQWYKLRIDINAAGTQASFYIDGNLITTLTTNIPATSTALGVHSVIVKTVGTTARAMQTDYFMYDEIFTNPR
jgi:hypothetical protein